MSKVISFAFATTLVLSGCGQDGMSVGAAYSTLGTGGGASSSATTGTGAAGGGGCVAASITIDGDGPTNHLGAACMGSWGASHTAYANGYLGYPGPSSGLPEQLFVSGCVKNTTSPSFGSLSLMVPQTTVGSATMGTASYANGLDTFTTDTAVTLMVSELDTMMVKGSYTATVSATNSDMKMLSGTFAVCRVPDFLPP